MSINILAKMSNLRIFSKTNCNNIKKIIYSAGALRFKSDWVPQEKVTHTGQVSSNYITHNLINNYCFFKKWEADDYRLVRFVDRPKHVNENFAINLIAEVPPKPCKERVIYCDGGGGPLGHPKVYINLVK